MSANKKALYEKIKIELHALFKNERDLIARCALFCAVIKQEFNPHWVGFYFHKEGELVLGPFQGPPACIRISIGKGVCGTSFARKETIVVPNVHEFEGHIMCSSLSNSEIVVPCLSKDDALPWAVLDIDSVDFNAFDETDKIELESLLLFLY